MTRQPASHTHRYRALPKGIWVLRFGSMFMDMSSELIHSLLPLFMATVLGASMVTIGIIEGIAEAAAAITRVFSGAISDYVRKRKALVILGYGLAALSKPLFPLATSSWWVFGARFIDLARNSFVLAAVTAVPPQSPEPLWGLGDSFSHGTIHL